MPITFADRLVAERERLGLSQGDLVAMTTVSRRAQFNYEQGVTLPDVGYLAVLANNGFDIPFLVTGERTPRYGAVDSDLLHRVLAATEAKLAAAKPIVDPAKKARLIALIYQTASEHGRVDDAVLQRAIDLLP
jgi:transcriptional regulator with XRE-family HTH domain